MASFRSEPFLWVHLAGIAVAPFALLVVWLALAIAVPLTPYWLELGFLVGIGVLPILWMQWHKPFEIFSLLVVALRPEMLTLEQRKILSLFKQPHQRVLTVLTALLMTGKLFALYYFAPLASLPALDLPQIRIAALGVAAIAFLIANLFVQVPVSVLGILLTSNATYEQISPIELSEIPQKLTLFGFRVKKIPLIPQGS
ncbi:MAG: low-complexity tail membrane protein [Merismopediaceae bacterium]|nr:low-complexity tail membrane protein [Merismopediaceae bacterium]